MGDYIQVLTTVDSREAAQRIASALVEQRLAGCVQVIGPVWSTYWWEGEVASDEEWMCLIKSKLPLYRTLEEAIRAVHPYDVPEILAVPILEGSRAYLAWLDGELRSLLGRPR
jgi:periplasmic divalent cation tolerance protein